MREGEIAFPTEPIITIQAPIIEAQVLETPMLCIMNHQMAVATKASRVTRATSKPVSEFGSRRAHGPWASVYGGKAAVIGGCANTSNILTADLFGFESSGTMAHSYTTSFGASVKGEYRAFDSYIRTHMGEGLILLIDTFDTIKSGLQNAIRAFRANGIDDSYAKGYGIRLDSGDLTYLSQECRRILDNAGMKKCKIFATNSLDEYLITELERQGACIDSYGVGDAIATSKHNPCFGNVYKLVQIGDMPVLKRSEDKIKLINPGFQITYRIIRDNMFVADVTCLRGDSFEKALLAGERVRIRAQFDETKTTLLKAGTYACKPLQRLSIENGVQVVDCEEIFDCRNYYLANVASLNPTQTRIINPHYYKVDISDDLYDLKMRIINNIISQIDSLDENGGDSSAAHLVVDALNDFIDGALPCVGGEAAAKASASFIEEHQMMDVCYIMDSHPENHCSFEPNGGTWPVHCVKGSRGGELHEAFHEISERVNRPCRYNCFFKGEDANKEQYSGYEAVDCNGLPLSKRLPKKVYVSGMATEFCIKATCLDLLAAGHEVILVEKALAYVDKEAHLATLKELEEKGAKII